MYSVEEQQKLRPMSMSEITEKKSVLSLICKTFHVNSFNTVFKKRSIVCWGLEK